jgi:hypothetical protein
MSKKLTTTLFLLVLIAISMHAQRNYLSFDYSISQFKSSQNTYYTTGLSERMSRCEGNNAGASYHLAFGRKNSVSIGMGLSKVSYQREWIGIFPESNQFGRVVINGNINYWSFPFSFTRTTGSNRRGHNRHYHSGNERFNFGFSISYTPSFAGSSSYSATSSGGAGLDTFLSGFHPNEQSFQHSLTVAICDQVYLFDKSIRLDLEPFAGIGSGYFKESGSSINTISFGLRLRIALSAKLPNIRIEKDLDKGNAEEKKKLLEQKQKEIEEQLNRNPK